MSAHKCLFKFNDRNNSQNDINTQPTFICSKSSKTTLEKGVKKVQS